METHFTFPDGALRYDCPSCRQRCCRGKGFSLGPEELVPLLRRVPALAAHLKLGAGGSLAAVDLTDRCWFLQGDGACGVEVTHGRPAKPSTCRLFPFNRVFLVDGVRVVDVNSQLCPIEATIGGVTHAELAREIDALAGSPLIDVPVRSPPALGEDWLALERHAAAQAMALASEPDALATSLGDADPAPAAAAWTRVFGLDQAERLASEAVIAPSVALLSSSLRYNALFREHAAPYPERLARLPRRLRALTFLGAVATRTLGEAPSLRSLTELWQAQAYSLDVLERWDERVVLRSPRFDAEVPELMRPALGTMLGLAFRGASTLGALVEVAASQLEPTAAPLAIALAASQLETLFGAC